MLRVFKFIELKEAHQSIFDIVNKNKVYHIQQMIEQFDEVNSHSYLKVKYIIIIFVIQEIHRSRS